MRKEEREKREIERKVWERCEEEYKEENRIDPPERSVNINNNNNNNNDENAEEERRKEEERIGKRMKKNEWREGENYVRSIGRKGKRGPLRFINPTYLTTMKTASEELIAISDQYNGRVEVVGREGEYRTHVELPTPLGVAFIPSLNLLAVASMGDNNQILFYSLPHLLASFPPPLHLRPLYAIPPSPMSFSAVLSSAPSPLRFKGAGGMAYSEEMHLLAVCDYWNKRIQLIGGMGEGEEGGKEVALHSSLSLSFTPHHVAFTPPLLSSPALLLVPDHDDGSVEAFAPSLPPPPSPPRRPASCVWVRVRLFSGLGFPRGVALFPSSSPYVVVCDGGNVERGIAGGIKLFSFSSSALLCSFNPSGDYFQKACGVCVLYPLIAVSDPSRYLITFIRPGLLPSVMPPDDHDHDDW